MGKKTVNRKKTDKEFGLHKNSNGLSSSVFSIGQFFHASPKAKRKKLKPNKSNNYSYGKPNRKASLGYAFKGGNAELLKNLRQRVDSGELTNEQALAILRSQEEIQIEEVTDIISNEERLKDIRKRKERQKAERKNSVILDGFLYLVINPAYPDWVKVGHTTDYEKRLSNYQTSSPFADYEMIACKWVENSFEAEQAFLSKARLAFEVRGEWIKVSIDDLIKEF